MKKQGETRAVSVKKKRDQRGIGADGQTRDSEWVQKQAEYTQLLQEINHAVRHDLDGKAAAVVRACTQKKESTLARRHVYSRFVRNKNVAAYSEKDLSAILGVAAPKAAAPRVEPPAPSQSIQDYLAALSSKKV